ncbi:hypothetical protein BC938DRAFT_478057 [Jimgerdemannia flammicorona]|uniref:Uncharacterized protein n=1 Tax=Jimgerdemannia flammicorona TaxID=994334 RepID=A0A433QNG0_9FUNG|nr:hypothetical protein BC938DRAFT_478057 [Jimgerdemannia flammicorona]
MAHGGECHAHDPPQESQWLEASDCEEACDGKDSYARLDSGEHKIPAEERYRSLNDKRLNWIR